MEFLEGATLFRSNRQEVPAAEALKDKEIIGFYFSAHWCPPCKMFTPILADFYEELKEKDEAFEIIFISSDHSADALFDYMNECHGDWLAAPLKEKFTESISQKFQVSGIPMLVIVKKDGQLVTQDGRKAVQTRGAQAYADWKK